jgi:hypothetical protein
MGLNIGSGTPWVKSEFHVKPGQVFHVKLPIGAWKMDLSGAAQATRRRQRIVSTTRLWRSLGDTPGMRAA